jgi:hypothetical protein
MLGASIGMVPTNSGFCLVGKVRFRRQPGIAGAADQLAARRSRSGPAMAKAMTDSSMVAKLR